MNEDRISGNRKQFKGKMMEQWGKLTDDDMDVAEGKRDQLAGRIQERYGYGKEQAKKELKDWEDSNQFKWLKWQTSGTQDKNRGRAGFL